MAELRSRRVRAAWADIGLLFVAFLAFAAAAGDFRTGPNEYGVTVEGLPALMYFLFILAYYFVLELAGGQTLGKRWLGIAVVNGAAEGAATPRQVAVRTLLRIVDWAPILYIVGYIAIRATGERAARLGDLAAKTSVGPAVSARQERLSLRASLAVLAALAALLLAAAVATDSEDSDSEPDELSETQQLLADAAFRTANFDGPTSVTATFMLSSPDAKPGVIKGAGDPEAGVGISTMTIGDRSVEFRVIRETSWIRGLPDGGRPEWLQADTASLAATGQIDPSLRQRELFLLLGAENVEPRPDGPGGLESWQFTIDRERAIEASPAEDRMRVSRAISGPPEASFTGEVTVDPAGFVRSFAARVEIPSEDGEPAESVELRLTSRALAQPPRVQRPAPAEVSPADPAEVQAFVERWLDL